MIDPPIVFSSFFIIAQGDRGVNRKTAPKTFEFCTNLAFLRDFSSKTGLFLPKSGIRIRIISNIWKKKDPRDGKGQKSPQKNKKSGKFLLTFCGFDGIIFIYIAITMPILRLVALLWAANRNKLATAEPVSAKSDTKSEVFV